MPHPRDYLPGLDRIGLALETTCDALMTLQSIEALSTAQENGLVDTQVPAAISHLRQAIDALREAHAQGQTGLALGFVLARQGSNSNGFGGSSQSSPRRTA